MNIWVIGPGPSLLQKKHLISELENKLTLSINYVWPNLKEHFGFITNYWTWFDPHAAVMSFRYLKDNPCDITPLLLDPLCLREDQFKKYWARGSSCIDSKLENTPLSSAERNYGVITWKEYEYYLQLFNTQISKVKVDVLSYLLEQKDNLGLKLGKDINFRFNQHKKTTICTNYQSLKETSLSLYILPICHFLGATKVFILGFDGLQGRFYNKKIFSNDFCGTFQNLSKWIEWIPYTNMKIYSVIDCSLNRHVPSLTFEKALAMND